ncbi:hypothetical protein ACFY20_36245 [Streptomyces sp. NPDC001312]|uniref:hypothetical protein n=1 Tax=Streptomyces sp. NPDC001312 TaxID=3364561 RepID=UPI0036BFD92F
MSDPEQIELFDGVFRKVFGGPADRGAQRGQPGDPPRSLPNSVPGRVPGTRKDTATDEARIPTHSRGRLPYPSPSVHSTVSRAATSRT